MLKTFAKITFVFLCGLALSSVLFFAWFSNYINSKEFRYDLTSTLTDIIGRKVSLDGDVDIAFFPWLGLQAHNVTIANENGFKKKTPFVSMRDISVGVKVLPVLSRRLEIRTVLIKGMRLNLMRAGDSQVNWDDFAAQYNSSKSSLLSYFTHIFIHGVNIEDTELRFSNEVSGDSLLLKGLSAHLGAFVPGDSVGVTIEGEFHRKRENINAHATLTGLLNTDFSTKQKLFEKTVLEFEAESSRFPKGERLRGLGTISYDANKDILRLKDLHARFASVDFGGHLIVVNLLDDFKATGIIKIEAFDPVTIMKRLGLKRSFKSLGKVGEVSGELSLTANEDRAFLRVEKLKADNTAIAGDIGIHDYSDPHFDFNFTMHSLNLDRYLPLFRTGEPFVWGDFSLPFWKELKAQGKVSVDHVSLFKTALNSVEIFLKSTRGTIQAKTAAKVFSGKVETTLDAHISGRKESPDLNFGMKARCIDLHSDSLVYSQGKWGEISGPINGEVHFSLKQKKCSSGIPSITALRNSKIQYTLFSPALEVLLRNAKKEKQFKDVTVKGKFESRMDSEKGYSYVCNGKLAAFGGKNSERISFVLRGPLHIDEDLHTVQSSGVHVHVLDKGVIVPNAGAPISVDAFASWDNKLQNVHLDNLAISGFGTSATGKITALSLFEKEPRYTGQISIAKTDLKHILESNGIDVYRMADDAALRNITLQGKFVSENNVLTFDNVSLQVDGTPISGSLAVTIAKRPRFDFDLKMGKIDLDRYLPPDRKTDIKKLRAGIDEDAPPVSLPLKTLRWLNLHGPVFLEEFIIEDIRISNLSVVLDAEDGTISVASAKADFYEGSLEGAMAAKILGEHMETAIDLKLKGFQSGPLLKDIANRDYVRGITNSNISLKSFGKTDDDIVAHLDGGLSFSIGKGSFKFSNWGTDKPPATDKQAQAIHRRTPFQTASSDWAVKKGYFSLKKLNVESPIIHCTGSGGFSPAQKKIDLSIKTDFVAVPSVTVHIVGHLEDPEVKMPGDKILTDTIKNIFGLPQRSLRFLRDLFF